MFTKITKGAKTLDERTAAVAEYIKGLKGVSDEDLAAIKAEALAEAKTLNEPDEIDDDALEALEALAEIITAAKAEVVVRVEEQEAKEAKRAAAAAALADEDEDEDADAGTDGENVDAADADEDAEADADAKEPVLAAGAPTARKRTTALRRAAAAPVDKAPAPTKRSVPLATITAAAEVGTFAPGQQVEKIKDLGQPTFDVLSALARSRKDGITKGIATFNLTREDDFTPTNDRELEDMLRQARDETRLPGGSLVAAGGWCAPSETVYGLCEGETTEGLWDLPSVNVARGGLNFTKGPQFSDFYAGNSIAQTEAQAISGTTKDCVAITCPAFTEVRLDVIGVCIGVPILTQSAYPEVVDRWISGTTIAHQHRKSASLITRALTIAGAAVTVANPWPTASGSLLAALELVVNGERQRYRLSLSATLEAVFPFWIKALLRADLSMRAGVDLINVTDQMLDAWFGARGIRAQYVYNWQPLVPTSSGAGVAIDYPATLEVLIYPAGTFVQGTKDVITLTGIYDSVGLSTNVYTALFTEEGISLMNMCYTPKRISIALQVTGLTGGAIVNQDWGTVATTKAAPTPVTG